MSEQNLKSCPFCGKGNLGIGDFDHRVWCKEAGCPKDAVPINVWQTRPVPAPKLDEDALRAVQAVADAFEPEMDDRLARDEKLAVVLCRDLKAALASPKADPKTEGLTDETVDRLKEMWLPWIAKADAQKFLDLCAQAKRCNALEREVEAERERRFEGNRLGAKEHAEDVLRLEAERNALRQTIEQMREVAEAARKVAGYKAHNAEHQKLLNALCEALAKGQPAEKETMILCGDGPIPPEDLAEVEKYRAMRKARALNMKDERSLPTVPMTHEPTPCPDCGGSGFVYYRPATGGGSTKPCPQGCTSTLEKKP